MSSLVHFPESDGVLLKQRSNGPALEGLVVSILLLCCQFLSDDNACFWCNDGGRLMVDFFSSSAFFLGLYISPLTSHSYTNDINPFGDSNLTEQFVWGKKREKDGTASTVVTKREMRDSQKKNVQEIEKV